MNSTSGRPRPPWKLALLLAVTASVFTIGIGSIGWAIGTWRADVTCQGAAMREGDTCAYIEAKDYRDEAYTPAGVRPVNWPRQRPGARMHSIQEVKVRDLAGMRSDHRRTAVTMALFGIAGTFASGYVTFSAIRQRAKTTP